MANYRHLDSEGKFESDFVLIICIRMRCDTMMKLDIPHVEWPGRSLAVPNMSVGMSPSV